MKLLQEDIFTSPLSEMRRGNDLFLKGIMMQAALKNGNGRVYPLGEITRAVQTVHEKIKGGHSVMGELNHPDTLSINLANVSHCIVECSMDGNNAIGKMKLLNTPSGNIAKGLIDGGIRLGVSSRGTGNVNESGDVSDFAFVTVDIVSQPSAPGAYPDAMFESLNSKKIMTLAESLVVDKKAQKYFTREINALIEAITKGRR